MYDPMKTHYRTAQSILYHLAVQGGPDWRKYHLMQMRLNHECWFNFDRYLAVLHSLTKAN